MPSERGARATVSCTFTLPSRRNRASQWRILVEAAADDLGKARVAECLRPVELVNSVDPQVCSTAVSPMRGCPSAA